MIFANRGAIEAANNALNQESRNRGENSRVLYCRLCQLQSESDANSLPIENRSPVHNAL
jgi:hypothetical protein